MPTHLCLWSLTDGQDESNRLYYSRFAMLGCINAQYGSSLPVTCFAGSRGAIARTTLGTIIGTVMRRALFWAPLSPAPQSSVLNQQSAALSSQLP
ncbi:hypothetical protein J7T55_004882 [Diaporthe amygdali]|uniref:uncharacterized protein n=1 Tax=Phomopsis amygdali TaxID=1214568 RepID=UPI0022FE26AF|nr:uncharacterized protein J7T55_004882 [Diaporthe amygdali]KAJ0114638.1 hypothetical protein J7T55_004882 [Diaporthe amygdali]